MTQQPAPSKTLYEPGSPVIDPPGPPASDASEPLAPGGPAPGGDEGEFRFANLGRHSLIYGIGIVLSKAVAFLMLPVYTRLLSPADYGTLQLVNMVLEVMSIFAGSRIALGIFHFYHKARAGTERKAVLSTSLMLLTLTYGMAATLTFTAAPWVATVLFGTPDGYTILVRIAAASMAFECLLIVPISLFQLRDRSMMFVAVSLGRLLMQLALNLILLIPFEMGVKGVLLSSLLTNGLFGVVLAATMVRDVGLQWRRRVAGDFVRFGLPLVVMQIATMFFTFGDRYFLNRAAGTAAVGIYGLAYQFGFLVVLLGYGPFERVWDPQRFAIAKQADRDVIYARVFVYLNIALLAAGLGLVLFVGDVLRLIATPEFHGAAVFVPIIVAAYVFQAWGSFHNIGIYITERTGYFTLANWAAAGVAAIGFFVLIPPFAVWGAAITTLLSLATRFGFTYFFSQRLWPIAYEWTDVVRTIVLTVAVGGVGSLLPHLPLIPSIGAHTVLMLAYLGLLWAFILRDGDRDAVRVRVRMLRQRLAGGV